MFGLRRRIGVFVVLATIRAGLGAPATTSVRDVLYNADSTPLNGIVVITWPAFTAADGTQVPASSLDITVSNGQFSADLIPTTNAQTPATYSVQIIASDSNQTNETWSVPPSSSPVSIALVLVSSAPGGTVAAAQAAAIDIGSVAGLASELAARPVMGTDYAVSRAAVIDSTGAIAAAAGDPSDCVKVDGTSGPCAASTNAATATALASTPTLCSSGQAAQGILANGNATGCFTAAGSPGGANTAVQYNNNGSAFGGDATNFYYNPGTHALTVNGPVNASQFVGGTSFMFTGAQQTLPSAPAFRNYAGFFNSANNGLFQIENSSGAISGTTVAPTTCTNQVVTGVPNTGTPICSTLTSSFLPNAVAYNNINNEFTTGQTFSQSANGDMVSGSRFTDMSPTGNFLNFKSAAGASLWQVDVTGTLQAGTVPGARVSGSISGNAGTASALASAPSQCASGQFATGISASGNANCGTPTGGGNVRISGSTTAGNVVAGAGAQAIEDSGKPAPSGAFVGTTDAQTLTNKTLTAPVVSQGANGNDIMSGARFTDSSPSGNFENFKSAAGTSLWQVDVTGTLQAGTVPGVFVSGNVSGNAATATALSSVLKSAATPGGFYDLVVDGGADPTGNTPANTAVNNAMAHFSGTSGGTIGVCGTFTLTSTVIITQPGLKFVNNCGVSGSALGAGSPQPGGAVFQGSTNLAIPNQTAGPIAAASTTGGSLAAGTYYIATTLTNGSGAQTLISPSASATVASGSTGSITVSYPQYQSGGVGYYIYCSTDNIHFYVQLAANFNGSGALTGPPFVTGVGTSSNPVLNTCTTSGTTPPATNATTNGMFLFQIGTNATDVVAGPVFDNVTFQDNSFNTLGGGVIIVQAQRTKFIRPFFRGFQWKGSSVGGALPYEYGAIALAITSNGSVSPSATNYTSVQDAEFNVPFLGIMNAAPDTDVTGGDITVWGSGGGLAIDCPHASANIRVVDVHGAQSGSGGAGWMVIRGDSSGGSYGNIVTGVKIEGQIYASGPAIYLRQGAHNAVLNFSCIGDTSNASRACVQIDSTSASNTIIIGNELNQCAFSDGTTCGNDPSHSNVILSGGSSPNNVEFPASIILPAQKATTGTRYLCIDTNGNITSSASACSGT